MVRKDISILPTIGPVRSLPDGGAWVKISRIWAMTGVREAIQADARAAWRAASGSSNGLGFALTT
jgi:hypothetical protein